MESMVIAVIVAQFKDFVLLYYYYKEHSDMLEQATQLSLSWSTRASCPPLGDKTFRPDSELMLRILVLEGDSSALQIDLFK
jgi:hypothetical protein